MKRLLPCALALALAFSLVSCARPAILSGPSEPDAPSCIDVKGLFLLEPADDLDLSNDLESVQRYLFVVYDVASLDSNQELSSRSDSIELTLNGANTYEQKFPSYNSVFSSFVENCGYQVSTDYGTLWSGEDPVRMVAAFAVNKNDVEGDCHIELDFDLANPVTFSGEYTSADVQTIDWMDDIFAVEDDPDAYQIAHSLKVRAELCKSQLELASQESHNGDTSMVGLRLEIARTFFSEISELGGVDCAQGHVTTDLPALDVDAVQLYYPELAKHIPTVYDNLSIMCEELDKEEPDYEKVNDAQRTAYNTLGTILDFFDAE